MNRRQSVKTAALLGAAFSCGVRPKLSYGYMGPKAGELDSSLEILNLWEKQPEAVNQLYSAIYQSLATDPKASFAAVVADETVQALCKAQGLTHYGGPMLGCLAPDGRKFGCESRSLRRWR